MRTCIFGRMLKYALPFLPGRKLASKSQSTDSKCNKWPQAKHPRPTEPLTDLCQFQVPTRINKPLTVEHVRLCGGPYLLPCAVHLLVAHGKDISKHLLLFT